MSRHPKAAPRILGRMALKRFVSDHAFADDKVFRKKKSWVSGFC
jgi:hypothetical protein